MENLTFVQLTSKHMKVSVPLRGPFVPGMMPASVSGRHGAGIISAWSSREFGDNVEVVNVQTETLL